MNWKPLHTSEQLEEISEESKKRPVLIFKHSINCSISSMMLSRLERKWSKEDEEIASGYLLDLIRNREVSKSVSERFQIPHQSPQVLVIRNGEVVFDTSHLGISYNRIKEAVE